MTTLLVKPVSCKLLQRCSEQGGFHIFIILCRKIMGLNELKDFTLCVEVMNIFIFSIQAIFSIF